MFHSYKLLNYILAIHKMTERTLAASPNLDARQRTGTIKETSPPSTQVY